MSITTDLALVATDVALVSDANTKAALTAIIAVLNDLNVLGTKSTLNTEAGVHATGTTSTMGGNYDILAGVPHASTLNVPTRVVAASTINNNQLNVVQTVLPGATHNVAYSTTLTAVGGSGVVANWAGYSLPTGLTLNAATGVLSGTLTSAGARQVIVTVTDTAGNQVSAGFMLGVA